MHGKTARDKRRLEGKPVMVPISLTANQLAQLGKHWTIMWEVAGSNPSRINTPEGSLIIEEKVLPL